MNDRIPSAAIGNLIDEIERLTIAVNRLTATIEPQSDGPAGPAGGRGSVCRYIESNRTGGTGGVSWIPPA
jgi:hypothetical protein